MANSFKTILLGAAGSGGASYFITYTGTSANESGGMVTQDSSGNYYQNVSVPTANYTGPGYIKYNKDGGIIATGALSPSVGNVYAYNTALVDGSGNVFLMGAYYYSSGQLATYATKLNSSNVVQWQKRFGANYMNMTNGVIDSNGNIYFSGFANSDPNDPGAYTMYLIKINTNGGIVWQKYFGTSLDDRPGALGIDSSDNLYLSGYDDGERGHHCKINSSGALQWQRETGQVNLWDGLGVSSGGNQLTCGRNITNNLATGLISLYNTSGSLQWSRKISSGSTQVHGQRAAFDSAGNVYAMLQLYTSPSLGIMIKFNSSGAVQWQRSFAVSNVNMGPPSITIDSNDDIILGRSGPFGGAGGNEIMFAKLNPDGSGTGQYGNLIYASASLTVENFGTGVSNGNQLFNNTGFGSADVTHIGSNVSKSYSQTSYSL